MDDSVSSTQAEPSEPCRNCTRLQSRLERALRQLERQLTFGEEVRAENERLKQRLQNMRHGRREETTSGTQTEMSADYFAHLSFNNAADAVAVPCATSSADEVPVAAENAGSVSGDPALEAAATGGGESVADMLRDAANECLSHNGYVYDEKSGLYYDYGSGYYYDPHRQLFYEPRSGTYYAYNEETREYRFHSRENPERLRQHCERLWIASGQQHAPPPVKKARRGQRAEPSSSCPAEDGVQPSTSVTATMGSKAAKESPENGDPSGERREEAEEAEEDVEEGEITSESENEECSLSEDRDGETEHNEEEFEEEREDEEDDDDEETYAPCVRLMVTSSTGLTVGSLYIVTCCGGTIGRTSKRHVHAVSVDGDPNVAECACEIEFDGAAMAYRVRVKDRSSKVSVNDVELRKGDAAAALQHRDRLAVGSTQLAVHIHAGSETCFECEPGLALEAARQAAEAEAEAEADADADAVSSSTSLEQRRRSEMRRLRSKFGLRGAAFEQARVRGRDRAAERRREKGSDGPASSSSSSGCAEGASAHRPLPASNRGARLLAKMGWRPGQALGKEGSGGRVEPVTAEVRLDPQAGLGSGLPNVSLDAGGDPGQMARFRNWKKMRERYSRLEAS